MHCCVCEKGLSDKYSHDRVRYYTLTYPDGRLQYTTTDQPICKKCAEEVKAYYHDATKFNFNESATEFKVRVCDSNGRFYYGPAQLVRKANGVFVAQNWNFQNRDGAGNRRSRNYNLSLQYFFEQLSPECVGCGRNTAGYINRAHRLVPEREDGLCRRCVGLAECPSCGRRCQKEHIFGDKCVECTDNFYNVRPHDYKPPRFIKQTAKPDPEYKKTGLLFGIELEVHVGRENNRDVLAHCVMEQLDGNEKELYIVHDGTVRPGFEIVTHPISWAKLQEDVAFWRVVNSLPKYVDPQVNADHHQCGVHVHMSRESFTKLQLYKFMQFVYEYPKFMDFINRREPVYDFCKTDLNGEPIPDLIKRGKSGDRYRMINLENDPTIELRGFKSFLDEHALRTYLEFCHALWSWTKNVSMADCTVAKFIKYVEKTKYTHLKDFLSNVPKGHYKRVKLPSKAKHSQGVGVDDLLQRYIAERGEGQGMVMATVRAGGPVEMRFDLELQYQQLVGGVV